jgi:hypothetical protein
MNYILVVTGAEYAIVVVDENGENKVFDKKSKQKLLAAKTGWLLKFKRSAGPFSPRVLPVDRFYWRKTRGAFYQ